MFKTFTLKTKVKLFDLNKVILASYLIKMNPGEF